MSDEIQRKPQQLTLSDLIAQKRDSFAKVAAKHYDPDRLVKLAQAVVSQTPAIGQCSPGSVLLCLVRCAELGLEPNSALPQRRMWLVPRWNSKTSQMECTPQIDYRAQLQLARDTGLVESIMAVEAREKDEFSMTTSNDGTSLVKFTHKPKVFGDRGPVVGYYAAARLRGGEVHFFAMSRAQMEQHRDRFAPKNKQGKVTGPWVGDFDAMALKTVLRRLWNLLPAGESDAARRVQEKLAQEDEESASLAPAIEVVPQATVEPKTERVKRQLRGEANNPQTTTESAPAAPVPPAVSDEQRALDEAFEREYGTETTEEPAIEFVPDGNGGLVEKKP